jgi:hypothetical protein
MLRSALKGMIALLLLAASATAWGQIREDEREPADLGILDLDSVVVLPESYLGNDVCQTCHPSSYQKWLGAKHARAFVSLRSRLALKMGETLHLAAPSPDKSGKCLRCHATAYNVPAASRAVGFRMGEGVTCERCHGPGERHVEAATRGGANATVGLKMPAKEDCLLCHRPDPAHAGMLEDAPFSFAAAWKKIAHAEHPGP